MLKKSLRLRAAEVEQVLKGGRSVRSAHMQVKALPYPGSMRSAAVVAKSVARKANARNTLRRAVYRALAAAEAPMPHVLAVFFLRVVPPQKPSAVIKQEVAFLLSKLS